jgi:hypothetical protein
VTKRKLLLLTILMLNLMLTAGCHSISKVPFQDGVDYIGLEKGQTLVAPVRGQFLSDNYYQYREEACK